MILNHFPKTDKVSVPRITQVELLTKSEIKLEEGCTKLICCVPTGGGKSADALTFLNRNYTQLASNGIYTSPLNVLVDQIEKEYKIPTLKGRNNYPCIAKAGKETCEDGYCQEDTCLIGKERNCKAQPYTQCNSCVCNSCIYKKAIQRYKHAPIANTNFTLFSFGVHNEPNVLVIDESDCIESTIRIMMAVNIKEEWGKQSFEDYLVLLEGAIESYNAEIENERSKLSTKQKRKLANKVTYIENMLNDYNEHKEQWNVKIEHGYIKFEPVTIDRFLEPLYKDKVVILLSATPFRFKGFEIIEVDSEFPADIRPWMYVPLGKMTLDGGRYEGSHRATTIPKIADWIIESLSGKTLVHCISYANANRLHQQLNDIGVCSLLQQSSFGLQQEDTFIGKDIIQKLKDSKNLNEIALTVNLGRGVDCPEPEICNNVIIQIPNENPTDSLVQAKNRILGLAWQNETKANNIMQMYGRINRGIISWDDAIKNNPDLDFLNKSKDGFVVKNTYILDSNFNGRCGNYHDYAWYSQNQKYFYNWFKCAESK